MLGGALSGGVMAGGSVAINAYQNGRLFKEGLKAPEGSEIRKAAEQIRAELNAGQKVSQAEYEKLRQLIDADTKVQDRVQEYRRRYRELKGGNRNGTEGMGVHDNGVWTDDQGSEGQSQSLYREAGRTEENKNSGRARSTKAGYNLSSENDSGSTQKVTYGETVHTSYLGIKNGSDYDAIRLVTGENADIREAREILEDAGIEPVFFGGGDLHIDGTPARGALSDGKAYIRVDNPRFSARQIALHERAHAEIAARGDEAIYDLEDRIITRIGEKALNYAMDIYRDVLQDANMTHEEILEELIADALADMNAAAGAGQISRMMDRILGEVKAEADDYLSRTEKKSASGSGGEEESGQVKKSYTGKKDSRYDYPDFNDAEWALYNRTRVTSEGTDLDENKKMFYASSKGKTIFAVMSTDDDTLLYGSSGKQAVKDYEYALERMEGKNVSHRNRTTLDRLLGDFKSRSGRSDPFVFSDGYGRSNAENVPLPVRQPGRELKGDTGKGKEDSDGELKFSRATQDSEGEIARLTKEGAQLSRQSDRENAQKRLTKGSQHITANDVAVLQSIGRKSVSRFTSNDIKKAEKWARVLYSELGAKSPFFRTWFGDWRENDTSQIGVVNIPEYVGTNDARKQNRGTFINSDTGWNIRVSRQGETNTISHSGEGKMSEYGLSGIKELVENAVLLNSEVHEHHNNDPRNDLIAFDHKLYTIGFRESEIGLYRVTVEESFHDPKHANERVFHNLKYIEKVATVGGRFADFNLHGVSTSDDIATTYNVADLYRFVKKYDNDFSGAGKPNEAMLNEDGTPKIVYPITDAKFTMFDRTKGRSKMDIQGTFFSPWKLDVQGYGGNVGAYYLNIENPAPEEVAYRALNRFKGQKEAGIKARNYLESLGYDGVNISDEEFIAFYPGQIKSATDNIGTFDGANSDTRLSRVTLEEEDIEAMEYELLEAIKEGRYDLVAELIEEYRRKGGEANRRRKLRAEYERAFYADKVKKLKIAYARAKRAKELEDKYEENTRR